MSLSKCLRIIRVKRDLGHLRYSTRVKPYVYKFSVSLSPELIERMDEVVELLGLKSREELIRCAILRFVDKYPTPEPKAP